ncbi:MAG TPA: hypothetical protein VGN00_29135 [Puia sp.]|jgi:hypothetical protein
MNRYTLFLAVILVLPASKAIAQSDTSKYDLGSLKLNKNFTQNITIRGADLEKMPFTDLSDAIAPWLYGAYTTPNTVTYVVDGNPVSDVNAYSIYDIEEVVLVQQAAGQVGAFGTQRQLVLIKTKRGKGKQGITAGAQTGLVNASGNGMKTRTNMYHQYYVGAYRNLSKISYGLSGDYQRDVFPIPREEDIKSTAPVALQRWRLNGYFTWRPNAANRIEATMNYAPQHGDEEIISGSSNGFGLDLSSRTKQHLILPRLSWHSEILPGLKNDIQVAWLGAQYMSDGQYLATSPPPGNPMLVVDRTESKGNSLRVNERLSYEFAAGGWKIVPAVNASYEHIDQKYTITSATAQNVTGPPYNLSSGINVATSSTGEEGKAKVYMLTPAVDITLNRVLNINGGVFLDVSGTRFRDARKSSAFASVGVDLLQLGKAESDNSLKIFGSYAQQTMLTSNNYALGDLTNGTAVVPIATPVLVLGSIGSIQTAPAVVNPYLVNPSYWVWESGVSWSMLRNRVSFEYTLEQRRPSVLSLDDLPYSGSVYEHYEQWHSTLHHFGIDAKILDRAGMKWESRLNLTFLKGKTDTSNFVATHGKPGVGEFNSDPYSWMVGWVNRLRLGQFTAGLDLLYHLHETVYAATNPYNTNYTGVKVNSFVIPNIYAGYELRLPHGGLEIFAESRGLVRNRTQDLMDARRYYTIGGKFNL